MSAARHGLRKRVLARARRGEFASAREIGVVAGVTVQTALRWLREAGMDIEAVRGKRLGTVRSVITMTINDEMIRDSAQLLHRMLCNRVKKDAAWDRLRPSTRKQYMDISYAMLRAAAAKSKT